MTQKQVAFGSAPAGFARGSGKAIGQGDKGQRRDSVQEGDYRGGNNAIFAMFIVYVLFWYLQGGYRFPLLGSIRFEFILGAVLSFVAVGIYFGNHDRRPSGIGGWVWSLLLLIGAMVPLSFDPSASFGVFVDRVIKFALMGLFIAMFVTNPQRLRWFVAAFLLVGLKMAQEGVHGAITGAMIWENQGVMRLHGSTPNYGHPNSLGGVMLGFTPFIIYLLSWVGPKLRVVLIGQLIATLAVVVMSGSRTAYVAALVGLIFGVRKAGRRVKVFLIALIGLAVLALVMPTQYIDRAATIITQEDIEGRSISARKQILEDAWTIFLEHPFGVGVDSFRKVREEWFGRSQDTHNLYLQIATNLGIQGVLVFLGFIVALFRLIARCMHNIKWQVDELRMLAKSSEVVASHVRDLEFLTGICKALQVFLVIRLALGAFGMDLYEIYWWFVAGTAVAIWRICEGAQNRTERLLCRSDIDSRSVASSET